MNPRKKEPIKYCKSCNKLLERRRVASGLLEGYQQFLKREYCNRECRHEYTMMKRRVKERVADQIRKDRILTKDNIFDRYPVNKLDNGCWELINKVSLKHEGYYNFRVKINNKNINGLHRIVYHLFNDGIPKYKCICHSCNNASCVNPDHLYAGSRKDNTRDMIESNRYYKGGGNKKLTIDDIREIRKSPLSSYELAPIYDVTPTHIRRIKNYTRRVSF